MGHRDAIPEDPADFLRWARHALIYCKKTKREGFPSNELSFGFEFYYRDAKEAWEEYLKDPPPPPEPHLTDGFTIYWDKKRRFLQLYSDCFGLTLDENGRLDPVEFAKLSDKMSSAETSRRWNEYMVGKTRETAALYGMSDEWVEDFRRRIEERTSEQAREGTPGDDPMLQIQFMLFWPDQK